MQSRPSSSRRGLQFVLMSTSLCLLLIIAACSRKPNLIPYGFEGVFDDEARASTAARVDYSIVQPVDQNDNSINLRVSKSGERMWFWSGAFWSQPFWKSTKWYRINMVTMYGEPKPICDTKWKKPDDSGDVTEISCQVDTNAHMAKPILTLVDYWVDGDEKTPPTDGDQPTGTVSRLYYLVHK